MAGRALRADGRRARGVRRPAGAGGAGRRGGATIGLVGLDAVGSRVAELLRGFGSRVLAFDPYADPVAAAAMSVELSSLETVLSSSDIVSVHARLSDETRKMFDAAAFATMRTGARFINTARGELVDQAALLAAMESGHLAGAALDVFDPEPPDAADPLLARPDVICTPHLAGASRQVALESVQRVTAEVAGFLTSSRARPGRASPGRERASRCWDDAVRRGRLAGPDALPAAERHDAARLRRGPVAHRQRDHDRHRGAGLDGLHARSRRSRRGSRPLRRRAAW